MQGQGAVQGGAQSRFRIPTRPGAGGPERISVACGNIPAPGLGKSVCKRKFAFDGGAYGNLQVICEIRYQKTRFWTKIGAKRVQNGAQRCQQGPKWSPKGATRDQNGAQRVPKGSQMEPKGCQKGAKWRPKCLPKSMSEKGRQKGGAEY